MKSKHSTCPHAASGCNWPEGECIGLCTPVQLHDDREEPAPWPHGPFDLVSASGKLLGDPCSCGCNEIPTSTVPMEGWGWVIRIFNCRVGI